MLSNVRGLQFLVPDSESVWILIPIVTIKKMQIDQLPGSDSI